MHARCYLFKSVTPNGKDKFVDKLQQTGYEVEIIESIHIKHYVENVVRFLHSESDGSKTAGVVAITSRNASIAFCKAVEHCRNFEQNADLRALSEQSINHLLSIPWVFAGGASAEPILSAFPEVKVIVHSPSEESPRRKEKVCSIHVLQRMHPNRILGRNRYSRCKTCPRTSQRESSKLDFHVMNFI